MTKHFSQLQNLSVLTLTSQQQKLVNELTDEIRYLVRRTAQNIIDIGSKLLEVKEIMGHGHFVKWLETEFNWSVSTASKMMQASKQFKNVNFTNLNISPSAIYLLAAPSTPDDARAQALSRASEGESISYSIAKELVNCHKVPKEVALANKQLKPIEQHSESENAKKDILPEDEEFNSFDSLASESLSFVLKALPDYFLVNDSNLQLTSLVETQSFLDCLTREWLRMMREKQFLSVVLCAVDSQLPDDGNPLKFDENMTKKLITSAIYQTLKRPSDFFTHYGRGCFLLLLSSTEPRGATVVAKSIQDKVRTLQAEKASELCTSESHFHLRFYIYGLIPSQPLFIKQLFNELLCHEVTL